MSTWADVVAAMTQRSAAAYGETLDPDQPIGFELRSGHTPEDVLRRLVSDMVPLEELDELLKSIVNSTTNIELMLALCPSRAVQVPSLLVAVGQTLIIGVAYGRRLEALEAAERRGSTA